MKKENKEQLSVIIDQIWIQAGLDYTVGVIFVSDGHWQQMAYIGTVKASTVNRDIQSILDWGLKLPWQQARGFFPATFDQFKYEIKPT